MNFLRNGNKKVIVLIVLLVFFGILLGVYYIYVADKNKASKSASAQTSPSPIVLPTIIPTLGTSQKNPSYKINAFIPTYSPEKGSGVDLQAPLVANSTEEIQKLYPFLPYEMTLKTPSGQEIDVVIPDKTSQTNPWTLQINIFGFDYGLTKGNPGYTDTKNTFVSVVSSLYGWIQEKGADPKKIMIIWGDKELIQNKSQEWLE